MRTPKIIPLIVAGACLYSPDVFAVGAYIVDDGNIVDPGKIEIESWVSHSDRDETLGVADISYQLLPNTEFTLVNTYDTLSGVGDTGSGQAKYLWWAGGEDSAIASSVEVGFNHDISTRRFQGVYAYSATTFTVNEMVDINLNFGWEYGSEAHLNFFTWGLNGELHVTEDFSLVGEVFGNNDAGIPPGLQTGLHYEFSKVAQGDIIYGRDITGTPANWVTLGMTFTF